VWMLLDFINACCGGDERAGLVLFFGLFALSVVTVGGLAVFGIYFFFRPSYAVVWMDGDCIFYGYD